MNTRITAVLVLAGLVTGAGLGCKSDPTTAGVGTPNAVLLNLKNLTLTPGDSAQITAEVVDERLTPLDQAITFSTCDASVAEVHPDPTFVPRPPTSARAVVVGNGLNATCVLASSTGAKPDTTVVVVLPTTFVGTVSSATPAGGDTLTINSTATLKFSPAATTVTFGGGEAGTIVSATADVLKVIVPFSDGKPLSISSVNVTYVPGLSVTLDTPNKVTQTGDFWLAAGNWQTAPDISGILPASGSTSQMIVHMSSANSAVCPEVVTDGSVGPCVMFKFTLADTATFNFSTDWEGAATDPDVDIYVCSDTTVANFAAKCFESGTAGATGAKPQAIGNFKYPAGNHWFVIENFCAGDPTEKTCPGSPARNHFVTILRP